MDLSALVARRGQPRTEAAVAREVADVATAGLTVELRLPFALLVSGPEAALHGLAPLGYRVRLLRDRHRIALNGCEIDIRDGAAAGAADPDVPAALAPTWPHHLVQLVAPPIPEWVHAIEARGIQVVQNVSAYALFVVGPPDRVEGLDSQPFVSWTGPFRPAYRISPGLEGRRGVIRFVDVGVFPRSATASVRRIVENGGDRVIDERRRGKHGGEGYGELVVALRADRVEEIACLPPVRWLEYVDPSPRPADERYCQVMAGGVVSSPEQDSMPRPGYLGRLADLGVDGSDVVIGICDTGVDTADDEILHGDLRGRRRFNLDETDGAVTGDIIGHGTHMAGVAVGSGRADSDATDGDGFRIGLGVAPGASFGSINNVLAPLGSTGTLGERLARANDVAALARKLVEAGAHVMNNSWTASGSGYTQLAEAVDEIVRDPLGEGAASRPLAVVFAAGNEGGHPGTIGNPGEAKNAIVVGATLGFQSAGGMPADSRIGIAGMSARGPATDGRQLPHVVAPGVNVVAARASTMNVVWRTYAGAYTEDDGATHARHTLSGGTSQAAAHVSGLLALYIQWWRSIHGGDPSQAMLKALLVNGAVDLDGAANWRQVKARSTGAGCRWRSTDGGADGHPIWRYEPLEFVPVEVLEIGFDGRSWRCASLERQASPTGLSGRGQWAFEDGTLHVVTHHDQAPNPGNLADVIGFLDTCYIWARDARDVGPIPGDDQGWGRVSLDNVLTTETRGPRLMFDQGPAFTVPNQEFTVRVAVVNPGDPLRVTLVWTDAAGAPGDGAPALMNNLHLEVRPGGSTAIHVGNHFQQGASITGEVHDNDDNVECVYVERARGTYEVTVVASELRDDARNPGHPGSPWQDFALVIENAESAAAEPRALAVVLDGASGGASPGAMDAIATAARLLIDSLAADDAVGVVTTGSGVEVMHPEGGGGMPVLHGPTERTAALAALDRLVSAAPGSLPVALREAADLLAGAPAGRSRAAVLISDGHDTAAEVGGPAGIPVYTCAIGPMADGGRLARIAEASGGRYHHARGPEDLLELGHFVRGRLTEAGLVANETTELPSARIPLTVEQGCDSLILALSWNDPSIRSVDRTPQGPGEIGVRIRDPRGWIIPRHSSHMLRRHGSGFATFRLPGPAAGTWTVWLETAPSTRGRLTLAGFVDSRLILELDAPTCIRAGDPWPLSARITDHGQAVSEAQVVARFARPRTEGSTLIQPSPGAAGGGDSGTDHPHHPGDLRFDRDPADALRHTAHLTDTSDAGPCSAFVTATGISPRTGGRFVRQGFACVHVDEP